MSWLDAHYDRNRRLKKNLRGDCWKVPGTSQAIAFLISVAICGGLNYLFYLGSFL